MGGRESRGVGDEVEDNNYFEDVQTINAYRYISYISRPDNDVVDYNLKAILIPYVSNEEIIGYIWIFTFNILFSSFYYPFFNITLVIGLVLLKDNMDMTIVVFKFIYLIK